MACRQTFLALAGLSIAAIDHVVAEGVGVIWLCMRMCHSVGRLMQKDWRTSLW